MVVGRAARDLIRRYIYRVQLKEIGTCGRVFRGVYQSLFRRIKQEELKED